MKLQAIRQKLQSSEYDFLRNNEHLGENIILLGLGGSHAYGTQTETSDLDIRGCAVNTKREILTNSKFEQVEDKATDTVIYSLAKLVPLLANCNPNCIELFGLLPEHYLYVSFIGQLLLDNKKLFLSKKAVHSFGGYANSQLYRLNQKSKNSLQQKELEEHILKTLQNMQENFGERYPGMEGIRLYTDVSEQENMDTEIYMDVSLKHYPLRDYCGMVSELQQTVKSYKKVGERNKKAIEHNKIGKHMMHLVRLYLMAFDILEKEEIRTYRAEEHDFLMDIRNGMFLTEDNQVNEDFFDIIKGYEKRLGYAAENTSLPEKPDYKKIEDLVMSINERVISR